MRSAGPQGALSSRQFLRLRQFDEDAGGHAEAEAVEKPLTDQPDFKVSCLQEFMSSVQSRAMANWWMDPDIMQALGFYGGGAATVIGGLWAAFKYFTSRNSASSNPAAAKRKPRGTTRDGGAAASVPIAAWIVLAIGMAGLTAAALSGGGTTTISNGASVGGDMEGSSIEIGR